VPGRGGCWGLEVWVDCGVRFALAEWLLIVEGAWEIWWMPMGGGCGERGVLLWLVGTRGIGGGGCLGGDCKVCTGIGAETDPAVAWMLRRERGGWEMV
jgi:hypothetical protein